MVRTTDHAAVAARFIAYNIGKNRSSAKQKGKTGRQIDARRATRLCLSCQNWRTRAILCIDLSI